MLVLREICILQPSTNTLQYLLKNLSNFLCEYTITFNMLSVCSIFNTKAHSIKDRDMLCHYCVTVIYTYA